MANFTPINTQEEFDRAISERIQRERDTLTKRFETENSTKITQLEGQISDLTSKLDAANKQVGTIAELQGKLDEANKQVATIAELQAKIKGYETDSVKTRIAREVCLPYELAARLSGDDEKALREDAESLRKLMGVRGAPMFSPDPEPSGKASNIEAWKAVSEQLKGE